MLQLETEKRKFFAYMEEQGGDDSNREVKDLRIVLAAANVF